MDLIVVVMKLYDYTLLKETNFAVLFCELVTDMKKESVKYIPTKNMFGNIAFTFYSTTSSFISCDGEYRTNFTRFNNLLKTKNKFPQIWGEIEEYVSKIKVRRKWSPYTTFFYPKLEQSLKNTEVEFAVKNELLPLALLTVAWVQTIYEEYLGMTKSHSNAIYKEIFLKERDADVQFIQNLITRHGEDTVNKFINSLSNSHTNYRGDKVDINCGFKMIPLNIKETQDPIKLRYKPWREYLVSNKFNEFVINSVAPGFAIILDWFYVKNSRKGLYDNKSQYDRLKNSELAKDILQVLYEAQRGTYFASENLKTTNKTNEQIKKWISNKFKKLNDKIEDPINFCIEEIIMSEVSLAFANEDVGRTISDTLNIISKCKNYDDAIGNILVDTGYDYFAKYMFDICYGLYCINSKFNVIHGDLHLNNACIGKIYNVAKIEKQRVLYVIDENYIFPNNGYYGCLIDFSRAIINPYSYEKFKDQSLPANFQLVQNEDKFILNEMGALLNLYIQLFPNKIRQKDELIVLFKTQPDATFKLLTCLDIYMFTIRLSRVLRERKGIGKKCLELVEKINKLSEVFISSDVNNLLGDSNTIGKKIIEADWPLLTIIKKCFPEYINGSKFKTPGTITDVYNYNNELKYSLSKYDLFPEIIKHVNLCEEIKTDDATQKNKCKTKDSNVINNLSDIRKKLRQSYESQKLQNLEMVQYIAMRHIQKLY